MTEATSECGMIVMRADAGYEHQPESKNCGATMLGLPTACETVGTIGDAKRTRAGSV